MKKIIIVTLLALGFWACNNKNQFTITGEVVPAPENGAMVLYGFEEGNPVPVDTVDIVEGKFKFQGEVEIPELNLMGMVGNQQYIAQLFVEPGKINMTVYPDSFESNVITGSESQEIFNIYIQEMITFSKNENNLRQRFQIAQMSNNEEEVNNIRFEYETMVENTQLYAKNFIGKYNSSPVSAYVYLMNFFQEAELEELDSILAVFEPIKASEFVGAIQERADALRVSGKGALAPDFTLSDMNGTPVTLSSLRGKYVLIDFWASWCQPCMIEMPNVIEQYKAYKDKGFEIMGVSLDRDREAWVSTVERFEMNWLHGWDMEGEEPGAVANMYGVTGIPHTVLLDREGKIIEKNLRGPALKAKLAELMD
ncbi:MAG: AhpC/TSA family protein [Prolixibacteraceae bacterium]|nr:AhpC/TSA family protein [Prolixibacteraceae bacterium]